MARQSTAARPVSKLRPSFATYLRLVSAAGVALLVALPVATAGSFGPLDLEFWLLAGLVLLGELYPIQVHGQIGEETFSTPFGFAILLVFGAPEIAVVQALASLTADLIRRRPADRIVFNIAQLTISWVLAGVALDAMGGTGLSQGEGLEASELPAVAVAAIVFFALNSTIVRVAEALQQSLPMFQHLVADLLFRSWSAGTLFVLGPPVAVVAENWLYLVPALALPMAAVHVASQQASAMERLALYDGLTGLPNRSLLSQRTTQALRRATGDELGPALLTLDLDRFRDVNDTLGRAQGDALLREVARRLERSTRASDTVARIGADEFAVLLPEVADRIEGEGATTKLLAALSRPIEVAGATLSIDASCGIALFPEHGRGSELLLQRAETAMHRAKKTQSRFEFYRPEMDREAPRRLVLVTAFKRAIDAPQHRAALPAQDRAGRAPRGGRRGPGALDRSGRGQRAAERLRAARRDDRSGRRLYPAHARAGHRRRPPLARGGLLRAGGAERFTAGAARPRLPARRGGRSSHGRGSTARRSRSRSPRAR